MLREGGASSSRRFFRHGRSLRLLDRPPSRTMTKPPGARMREGLLGGSTHPTALSCSAKAEHPVIADSLDLLAGLRLLDRPPSRTMTSGLSEHQSILISAARITLPHFSVSSAMSLPNASGPIGIGSAPRLASFAAMAGWASAAATALASLSITGAGVPLGAPRPNQPAAS